MEHSASSAPNNSCRVRRIPFRYCGVVVLLWLACLGWYMLAPSSEWVEHHYTRGMYRFIVSVITPATSAVPFSIILVMLAVLPLAFIGLWAGNWIYCRRALKGSYWRGFLWGPKWLPAVAPVLWLWFLLFWGIGYGRLPVDIRLDFEKGQVTDEELARIEQGLLQIILRDQPMQPLDRNIERALASVAHKMESLVEEWEGSAIRIPRRVKATPPGMLLMNGTSGICVPFTLEPHVDGGLPDTAFVSVGAHELGHIAGVCDEGETNLISYIAGIQADDPYARYAVALSVYRSVAGQRGAGERKAALSRLPEQAHEDMRRAREASERYRIDWFQKWSWKAYNQYLKSQGVKEGVRSYGRGTQLLVQAWRSGYLALPEPEATPPMPDAAEVNATDSQAEEAEQ